MEEEELDLAAAPGLATDHAARQDSAPIHHDQITGMQQLDQIADLAVAEVV